MPDKTPFDVAAQKIVSAVDSDIYRKYKEQAAQASVAALVAHILEEVETLRPDEWSIDDCQAVYDQLIAELARRRASL